MRALRPPSTHRVTPAHHGVTKRFRPGHRAASEREWRALKLLSEHAPGLAPEPLKAELTAAVPEIRMSRLPGEPLRGRTQDVAVLNGLAQAVSTLQSTLPPDVLATVPPRPGRSRELTLRIRAWSGPTRARTAGEARTAMDLGLRWLDRSPVEDAPPDAPEVFGAGDGNLANYLWDGHRVRIVDFEDSGRSDRPFELAEITEHVGSWADTDGRLDVPAFLDGFALTKAETARLLECRRLLALVWLFLLIFDEDRAHPRNPPGTAARQARRLTALLA